MAVVLPFRGLLSVQPQTGVVQSVSQVPWRSLGQSPVIVEIDSVFLLACPKTEASAVPDQSVKVNTFLFA